MLKLVNGFADLCIPYSDNQDELLETLNEAIDVGFKHIGVEQTYKHETISSKSGDQIPKPIELEKLRNLLNRKLHLYNRLTVVFSDNSISHTLARSSNFKKFHIVAALPLNESSLHHACQTFQGDMITYNSSTVKMRISRKFYYLALRRNIYFELKYSPAIEDSNDRQATIARAQHFHMSGKLKGIIISSGATSRYSLRSPSNISCLGLLFGLNEEKAKFAISTASLKVLVAAESRRLGRVPVLMQIGDTSTSETSSESDSELNENSKRKGKFVLNALEGNKKLKSC